MANPPSKAAKLVISRDHIGFAAEQALTGIPQRVSPESIGRFLTALTSEPVAELDPALFDAQDKVVRNHFNTIWTDDYPDIAIRLFRDGSPTLSIRSDSQHAGMLPYSFRQQPGAEPRLNWNPRLSEAIHALLPEGFLGRERLDPSRLLAFEAAHPEPTAEIREAPDAFPSPTAATDHAGDLDLDDIFTAIASGPDDESTETDSHGQTALMRASYSRDWNRFRTLVKAGADVEARRKEGMAGLHQACASGEIDAVREWILAGAVIEARTPEGYTPLMFASKWPVILRVLLEHGADVNAVDNEGRTVLVHAVLDQSGVYETEEAVKLLLQTGADPRVLDHEGKTPMVHAQSVLARVQLEREVAQAIRSEDSPLDPQERQKVQTLMDDTEALIRKTLGRRPTDDCDLAESIVETLTKALQSDGR